ncbi:hypothetical protein [Lentzea kentuckyensis]|jgi:hypothetical protein|uniref:hypothetical protein n=1 Tax=Lentzea kentuckyensis TaxID=360086 RepID=UPI000A38C390|nr:hypothetical protein [Lentzea kentuckyensis]
MTTTDALGGLPLFGWLVELLHQALLDAGMNAWLAQTCLKRPKPFVIALVFLFFLLWNVNTCLPGPTGCVTPVSRWTTDAGAWLDEQKVKGA